MEFIETVGQEVLGANLNCNNLGGVSTGPACLFEADIAGMLSRHSIHSCTLKGNGQFKEVYCSGSPENNVWPLIGGLRCSWE